MIAITAMTNISIPESLGLSALGLLIVFIVLIFLMVIIIIMTAIIRKLSKKPAMVAVDAGNQAAPPLPDGSSADILAPPAPVTEATAPSTPEISEPIAAPTPAPKFVDAKKYRVIVNGYEYIVDAETGETTPASPAPEPVASAPIPEPEFTEVPFSAPVSSETRKYKVIVDGVEYVVDAETGATEMASTFTPVFTEARKYKVIVDGAEYVVDAETDGVSLNTGSERR